MLTVVTLVLVAGTSMYHDTGSDRIVRPGFTVFAVDQRGTQAPLALFDGQAWRAPCLAKAAAAPSDHAGVDRAPPDSADADPVVSREGDLVGLAGSPGAPLLRVRELTGDSTGWEPTADAVETRALTQMPVPAPWKSEPRVYSADAAGSGVAYVEVLVREAEPKFRGLVASAWVVADDPVLPHLIDFHIAPFESYAEYLTIARQIPLGIADDGQEHVWVMKRRSRDEDGIRLVGVGTDGARERLQVTSGGC
jgi:hypothetical protein